MEEKKTRQALDELADLFLTDPGAAEASSDDITDSPDPDTPTSPMPKDNDTSSDTHHASATPPLDGPAPIRLAPKTPRPRRDQAASSHGPDNVDSTSTDPPPLDDFAAGFGAPASTDDHAPTATDEAPSLRLHRTDEAPNDSNDPDAPASAGPRSARVLAEAVLIGNLPGLSGPWLTQYAQRLAQQEGAVAILHVDQAGIDAELLEPADQPRQARRAAPGSGGGDLVEQLASLVTQPQAPLRRVLVRFTEEALADEPEWLNNLGRWTVLCGADNAAIVAAYRLLKRLVGKGEEQPHEVGLMLMGSEPMRAQEAAEKLQTAADDFLHTPIELVGNQRQMMPVNLRQLGRFEDAPHLWPKLMHWLQAMRQPAPAADEAESAPTGEPEQWAYEETGDTTKPLDDLLAQAAAESAAELAANHPEAEPESEPGPASSASEQSGPAEAPPEQPSPDQPTGAPHPATEAPGPPPSDRADQAASTTGPRTPPPQASAQPAQPTDASASAANGPDLSQFLTDSTLAGGLVLEARCPHLPDTQLVLDVTGRLHLLQRHAPAEGNHADADHAALRRVVLELMEVRKWVREHMELLQLTQRQCRFAPEAEPVLHLFTHRADVATGLVARLGDTLKLHLLKEVQVGHQTSWFCTPLN